MITAVRLRQLLDYDPSTGLFRWRERRQGVNRDMVAGVVQKDYPQHRVGRYRVIRIDGKLYVAHRLAWLWMTGHWPSGGVDHVNGERADNRWENLREATQTQNNANQKIRSDNTTGFKGVFRCRARFRAEISANGRTKHLGVFDTAEQAHAAYVAAATDLFGPFARAA